MIKQHRKVNHTQFLVCVAGGGDGAVAAVAVAVVAVAAAAAADVDGAAAALASAAVASAAVVVSASCLPCVLPRLAPCPHRPIAHRPLPFPMLLHLDCLRAAAVAASASPPLPS